MILGLLTWQRFFKDCLLFHPYSTAVNLDSVWNGASIAFACTINYSCSLSFLRFLRVQKCVRRNEHISLVTADFFGIPEKANHCCSDIIVITMLSKKVQPGLLVLVSQFTVNSKVSVKEMAIIQLIEPSERKSYFEHHFWRVFILMGIRDKESSKRIQHSDK